MSARNVLVVVSIGLLTALRVASAQDNAETARLAQLEAQLISAWWGKVQGEAEPRIMRIIRIVPRAEGNYVLDISYGILGGGQAPLKGSLTRQGSSALPGASEWLGAKNYKLEFTTGAGTVVSAESAEPGVFTGTFVTRSGNVKPIRLDRVSEDEIRTRASDASAVRRAAAEKWLTKAEVKIEYEGPYKATFTVDTKARMVNFGGSDDFCARGAIPAVAAVDDRGMLVFTFNPKRPGCPELQYSFDPLSKAGSIRQRPGDASPETPWAGPSRSKITLAE